MDFMDKVKARMKALTNTLERVDIDPKRLQVVEVPQGNPGKFTESAKNFMSLPSDNGGRLARPLRASVQSTPSASLRKPLLLQQARHG